MFKHAKWIQSPSGVSDVCPDFRKSFSLKGKIASARAMVSAYGVFELRIDGKKIGDEIMTPGWTNYENRIQVIELDVSENLQHGCTLSLVLGLGWALGRMGMPEWGGYTAKPDRAPSVIAEITILYESGEKEIISTDESWTVYTSEILFSELYDGETIDKTAEPRLLGNAVPDPRQDYSLVPQQCPGIIEHERIAPRKLIITTKGERVIDFGQNLAGYVEFRIKGDRGSKIVISHAEVLDKHGNFYTDNMRYAKNLCTYVLSGEEDVFKPSFSFQGFRYVRLDEYPSQKVDLSEIYAVAIYTNMERIGDFSCGNAMLNRLYENTVWGQKSNFLDVPTDCPQRDERFGWTGDAQVFCRTSAINFNVLRFFEKWLTDLRMEQGEDGSVSGTCPRTRHNYKSYISAAWGDAATVCPYEMYRAYGDTKILCDNLSMMEKWVEYMHSYGDDEFLFIGGTHYGDWLALDAGEGIKFGATQTDFIASAYFAYSTHLVVRARRALGLDTKYHERLYDNVRHSFRKAFMKDGMPTVYPKADAFSTNRPIKPITQTAISLILRFGLCNEGERSALASALVSLIRENGCRMNTGFVGTPHLLHALSENGYGDVAYDLILSEKSPSWLFSVKHGATTMWEHWDGINEEGDFWDPEMNSFNHYAYGSVGDWMFGAMVGISPDEENGGAGYRRIIYSPVTDKRVGFVKGSIKTANGKITSEWKYLDDGRVQYELILPKDVVAEVKISGLDPLSVEGGTHVFIL